MPNWCYCHMEITGDSVKQLKKINKLLTGKSPEFNSIGDVSYEQLFILDTVNCALARDKELLEFADSLAATFETTTSDMISYLYAFLRNHNSIRGLRAYAQQVDLDKLQPLVELLFKAHFVLRNERKDLSTIDNTSSNNDLKINNLLPDNPLSLYRSTFVANNGLVSDPDITKINRSVDDWYTDRTYNRYGTKWTPTLIDTILIEEDNLLIYKMETAWGPCDIFARILTEIFDVYVTIKYSEPGCWLLGQTSYYDGDELGCLTADPNNDLDWLILESSIMGDERVDADLIMETIYSSEDSLIEHYIGEHDLGYDNDCFTIYEYAKKEPMFLEFLEEQINECTTTDRIKRKVINKIRTKFNKTIDVSKPLKVKIKRLK